MINGCFLNFEKYIRRYLLIIFIPFAIYGHSAEVPFRGVVNEDNVNIRVDSRITSASLGKLSQGQLISVIESKFEWYRVILPENFPAFISCDYITMLSSDKAEITANILNIRQWPSLESPVIGSLQKGTQVDIIKNGEEWVQINAYPFATGWVHSHFIKPQGETAVDTVSRKETIKDENISPQDSNKPVIAKTEEISVFSVEKDTVIRMAGNVKPMGQLNGCPANMQLSFSKYYPTVFLTVSPAFLSKITEGEEVTIRGTRHFQGCVYVEVEAIDAVQ